MALVLETGVYMVGVASVLLIVLFKHITKLARAERLVNSAWSIRRECQILFFNV